MIASERAMFIINQLNNRGIIGLTTLAKELDVSDTTIRRDFEKLENEGKLKRVQGGAARVCDCEQAPYSTWFNEIVTMNDAEKGMVARHAAQVVKDGECVFLDAGTSMVPLIDYLANRKVKIVTYNELIVRRLINPIAEIYIIGGQFASNHSMSIGPIAQEMLDQFYFDHIFLSCSGVDLENSVAYTNEMESVIMKRIALKNTNHRYLLADADKLNKRGFYQYTSTENFDAVFCTQDKLNRQIPDNFVMVL